MGKLVSHPQQSSQLNQQILGTHIRSKMSASPVLYKVGTVFAHLTVLGKTIALEMVSATNAWWRPSDFPAKAVEKEFAETIKSNKNKLHPNTTTVALK